MKIVIDNIYTKVEAPFEVLNFIDKHFTVQVPGAWFSEAFKKGYWDGLEHFFDIDDCCLPTGLLAELRHCCKALRVNPTIVDRRPAAPDLEPVLRLEADDKTFNLTTEERNYQEHAVKLALRRRRGIIALATNAGKTVVAAAIIASLPTDYKVIFLVQSLDLLKQAKDRFEAVLGEPIGQFGAGKKQLERINCATTQTISKIVRKRPEFMKQFEAVFMDEAHHAVADGAQKVLQTATAAHFRIGLTATPFVGEKFKDWKVKGAFGPVFSKIDSQELIDRGLSATPEVEMLPSPDPDYQTVRKYLVVHNRNRNFAICTLAAEQVRAGRAVLILTPWAEHAKELFDLLREQVRTVLNYGEVPIDERRENLREFIKNAPMALIATTIYDEGLDVPEIDCLILAGAGRSWRKLVQRVGRVLRLGKSDNVKIFDFCDRQNHYLEAQAAARLNHFLREGYPVKGSNRAVRNWIAKKEKT